jgi:hypothetical protein
MNLGVAQVDITPPVGVEISGYAARVHPTIGVLDPLFANALYLEDKAHGRLLWIAVDVIAFDPAIVSSLRAWARATLRLRDDQVLLSATHTHSGPATAKLVGLGRQDKGYLASFQHKLRDVAMMAARTTEPAEFVFAQRRLELAVDRRCKPSAHTDPVVTALGWRRPHDGSFRAAMLNYAMHPVALGGINRRFSGDWCGYAAAALRAALPGNPVTLVSNGAAGNLNPPGEALAVERVRGIGQRVSDAVSAALCDATPVVDATIRTTSQCVAVPLELMPAEQIDAHVDELERNIRPEWDRPMREALREWREMAKRVAQEGPDHVQIEVQTLAIGPVRIVALNGEMFSRFTQQVRDAIGPDSPLFVVGYANDAFGYIPHAQAYDEGGYEVNIAHYFYNSFRPKRGGLELLAQRAIEMFL